MGTKRSRRILFGLPATFRSKLLILGCSSARRAYRFFRRLWACSEEFTSGRIPDHRMPAAKLPNQCPRLLQVDRSPNVLRSRSLLLQDHVRIRFFLMKVFFN